MSRWLAWLLMITIGRSHSTSPRISTETRTPLTRIRIKDHTRATRIHRRPDGEKGAVTRATPAMRSVAEYKMHATQASLNI